MSRFIKRNWKKLLVALTVLLVIVGTIFTLKVSTVDDVRQHEQEIASIEDTDTTGDEDISQLVSIQGLGDKYHTNTPDSENSKTEEDPDKEVVENKTETENNFVPDKIEGKRELIADNRKESDGKHAVTDSNGNVTGYVPDGKPEPVDEEDQKIDKSKSFYVYLSIDCKTILNNMDELDKGLEKYVGDGTILSKTKVRCYDGETVWDVLSRECKARGINLESTHTEIYSSVYVESINNLAEFDCGSLSGWCYFVDGWAPNYGCSRYLLKEGEVIRWSYTCDLGRDLGITWE